MGNVNCSGGFGGKSKKYKRERNPSKTASNKDFKNLRVKIEQSSEADNLKSGSFSVPIPFGIARKGSRYNVKVMNVESPVGGETEQAYEGEDEHDDSVSMKMEKFDLNLQAHFSNSNEVNVQHFDKEMNAFDVEECMDTTRSGHISDPGFRKGEFFTSAKLKRSCSDLMISDRFSPSKSFGKIQRLKERLNVENLREDPGSPHSVRTHCSADKVVLKKHSSSQILPSRSKKIWWKLFLWSHRNLHIAGFWRAKPEVALNQHGGYSSDTIEVSKNMKIAEPTPPGSFTVESLKIGGSTDDNRSWDGSQGVSGFWPQNQWVAFPAESSTFSRVDQWVKELALGPPQQVDKECDEDGIADTGKSPARSSAHMGPHSKLNLPEEILHANNVIRTLNSSSTVAHIASIGLKVIPSISRFSSLRSVNLSGNCIVHISPGSLPKGLHILNLSRNKIHTIEGLRDLTRLRVLDLSYNRISRIGQGLSNCTLIKELYLAGNRISEVEGLHRLLKLTILDLSFNKITTTKALGQLVANYNSLLALNLVGNPILSNISDDQLRKTLCSLLSKLACLNKQPVNPQKAREVSRDDTLKAAMDNRSRSTHRKAVKRLSQGGSTSSSVHSSKAHVAHRSKSQRRHHYSLKK